MSAPISVGDLVVIVGWPRFELFTVAERDGGDVLLGPASVRPGAKITVQLWESASIVRRHTAPNLEPLASVFR